MGAAGLPTRRYVVDAVSRAWDGLRNTGTWWSGRERVEIARIARSAMAGDLATSELLSDGVVEAVVAVAVRAFAIGRPDVERWTSSELSSEQYVELIGVVSRLASIDTSMRGLGAPLLDLPVGSDDAPARALVEGVRLRSAFVPMAGAAGATTALTAVPAEAEAQRDIHVLYLTYEQMGDLDIDVDLHRTQLELVAARTSLLNTCDY